MQTCTSDLGDIADMDPHACICICYEMSIVQHDLWTWSKRLFVTATLCLYGT